MRIIFFGTPDFAVASLEALVQSKFDVVAVVTAPDKPAGRGQQIQASPVKIYAEKKRIAYFATFEIERPRISAFLKKFSCRFTNYCGF